MLFRSRQNEAVNEIWICDKGRFAHHFAGSAARVQRPLIRRAGELVEATWDEALAAAAEGLRSADGAVIGLAGGRASNEDFFAFRQAVEAAGGEALLADDLPGGEFVQRYGVTPGTDLGRLGEGDAILVFASDLHEEAPLWWLRVKNAAKRGATLVVIDPRGQALKRHATHMLQFNPGTDVALLNALLHVIVTEELYDSQYVAAQTEGFERLKAHIAEFTPEAMSAVCGIDSETLRTVARTYARAESAIIFWGMGISQHIHGTDNARCLIALALITGQIGRPGTGLHPLRGQNNVQGASDAGLMPMVYPDYQAVDNADVRARFENAWGTPLDPARGLTVVEIMDAIHAGTIKGMYIMGENPAMSDPDAGHVRAALAKLEDAVRARFETADDAVGFAYAINGQPVNVRAFAHPRVFRQQFDAFVNTMAAEALLAGREGGEAPAAQAGDVVALVKEIEQAREIMDQYEASTTEAVAA